VGRAVGADGVDVGVDELADVRFNAVADGSDLVQGALGRVGDAPRLIGRRYVRAGVIAAHRHRPVGVQLHLAQ